jgi:hypothetical protein
LHSGEPQFGNSLLPNCLSRGHLVLLVGAPHHDLEGLVPHRPLQRLGLFHGARIQTSRSSSVVGITGIAFGWIGSTTAFGDVVRKP